MKDSFILFSEKNQDSFSFVLHKAHAPLAIRVQAYKGNKTIEIHSDEFQTIAPQNLTSIASSIQLPADIESPPNLGQAQYEERISNLQLEMKAKGVAKVVYSRVKSISYSTDVLNTLQLLKKQNPQSFCYYLQAQGQAWIGASPEILLEEKPDSYQTMSLAGTLPIAQDWQNKELKEQQYVTEYISKSLMDLEVSFTVSPIQNAVQSDFKHLMQTLDIQKNKKTFADILKVLHPTPAVCGLPKPEAIQIISKWEPHNRDLYTGYIELLRENHKCAYVNLRCAQLFENQVYIYVGGGITLDSKPEKEWIETELKSGIIIQALRSKN